MPPAPDRLDTSSSVRRRVAALGGALVLAGLAITLAAGFGAPQQPELFPTGGACQFAMCGELEDPPRWRAMWAVFGVGLALALAGLVTTLAALPAGVARVSGPRSLAGVAVLCLATPAPLGLAFAADFLGSVQLGYALPLAWAVALGACVHVLVFGRRTTRWSVLIVLVPALAPYAVLLALTAS